MNHTIAGLATVGLNEGEVITRAQQGDADAFEYLYKANCKLVYSLCLRMLKNAAEAEDLTQQVFLQLFRKIGTFRGDSRFSTWLHRISVNAVLMHLRRKRPPENLVESLEDCGRDGSDPIEQTVAVTTAPSVIDRLNLKRAIRKLPAGYKRFFLLHDVFGYRHGEIAELLGCSISCSQSQLHKARKSLRRLLRGEDAGGTTSQPRSESQSDEERINVATAQSTSCEKSAIDYFKVGSMCMTTN
jgi:RNA polymerase sigma-70 factor, ECF subfamily